MLFVEGLILASARYKIIQLILKALKKVTLKFLHWEAKYRVEDEASNVGVVSRVKNFIIRDKSILESRYNECLKCEYFIKSTSQCRKCGCPMKLKIKFSWASCPIGKWQKTYDLKTGKSLVNVV